MKPAQAYGFLQRDVEPTAAAEAVERARQAVAARTVGVGQDAIVTSVPAELAGHVSALEPRRQADARRGLEGCPGRPEQRMRVPAVSRQRSVPAPRGLKGDG